MHFLINLIDSVLGGVYEFYRSHAGLHETTWTHYPYGPAIAENGFSLDFYVFNTSRHN